MTAPHVQPVPMPETKLKPNGRVSVTVMVPVVVADPMLVTVSVWIPLVPVVKFPLWLLLKDRSG